MTQATLTSTPQQQNQRFIHFPNIQYEWVPFQCISLTSSEETKSGRPAKIVSSCCRIFDAQFEFETTQNCFATRKKRKMLLPMAVNQSSKRIMQRNTNETGFYNYFPHELSQNQSLLVFKPNKAITTVIEKTKPKEVGFLKRRGRFQKLHQYRGPTDSQATCRVSSKWYIL